MSRHHPEPVRSLYTRMLTTRQKSCVPLACHPSHRQVFPTRTGRSVPMDIAASNDEWILKSDRVGTRIAPAWMNLAAVGFMGVLPSSLEAGGYMRPEMP